MEIMLARGIENRVTEILHSNALATNICCVSMRKQKMQAYRLLVWPTVTLQHTLSLKKSFPSLQKNINYL